MAHAGDGSGRIFIVEQDGTVLIWDGSQLLAEAFLQIPVACCGERGLLGLAFHPSYATNGFFYVHYSNPAIPINRVDDFQNGDYRCLQERVLDCLPLESVRVSQEVESHCKLPEYSGHA